MRHRYGFGACAVLFWACVEVPAQPVASGGGADAASAPWVDAGARHPPPAPLLHAPSCAEETASDPPAGLDGGSAAAPAVDPSAPASGRGPDGPPAPGPGDVVVTELMANPEALADTAGEWIELHNPDPRRPLSLAGCELDDGGASPRSIDALEVPPGGFVTIARGASPGFAPDLVTPLSLSNASDRVVLRCGRVEIDAVSYDVAAGFPLASGASMALDPGALDADANDRADAWCLGQGDYAGGDQGTPGAPNPGCFGDGGVD